MLQIEKLIKSLPEDEYVKIRNSFEENRAIKFRDLLILYRNGEDEASYISKTGISRNAFNVLKSRLYEKIQLHLLNTEVDIEKSFLLHVFNIPHLLYSEEREIALAVLEGIEKEFKQHNLFQLLMFVYQAQKKLSHGSPRYYHYSRLYNRNVALFLSQDKADDELATFNLTMSRYYHSRNETIIPLLHVHKKEVEHLSRLNDTPRMQLYRIFISCSLQLIGPETPEDNSVEQELGTANSIIKEMQDEHKEHYAMVVNYLHFLYYTRLGLRKDSQVALTKTFNISDYKNYYPLISIAPFADSRIRSMNGKGYTLEDLIDPEELTSAELTDENEVMTFISAVKHDSFIYYINGKKENALRSLRDLINFISFKPYPFSEIEIKILYLIYSLDSEKEINQESILLTIIRKAKELGKHGKAVDHIAKLIKLLKHRIKGNKVQSNKAQNLFREFQLLNEGPLRILPGFLEHPSVVSSITR